MANSCTLNTTAYQTRYLKLTCKQTKEVAKNRSKIDWTLESLGGTSTYYSTGPTTVKINGETVYNIGRKSWESYAFPAAKGTKSGTTYVPHDSKGEKSIKIEISTAIYVAKVSTVDKTWKLDSIPRFATLSSPKDFDDFGEPQVTYNNPAGSAAKVQIGVFWDNKFKEPLINFTTVTGTSGTKKFALNDSLRNTIYSKMKQSNSINIYYGIKTTIGSNTQTNVTTAKKVYLKENFKPIFNQNEGIKVENTSNGGYYPIKGKGKVEVTIKVEARKGAQISHYKLGNNAFISTSNTTIKFTINPVNSKSYTVTIRDTRGDTTSKSFNIPNYVDYFDPQIDVKTFTSIVTQQDDKENNDSGIGSEDGDNLSNNTTATSKGIITLNVTPYYCDQKIGTDQETGTTISNTMVIKAKLEGKSTEVELEKVANTNIYTGSLSGLTPGESYNIIVTYQDSLSSEKEKTITDVLVGPVFDWNKQSFSFYVPVEYPLQRWEKLKMWGKDDSLNDCFCVYGTHPTTAPNSDLTDESDLAANVPQFTQQGNVVTVKGRVTLRKSFDTDYSFYTNYWFASGAPAPASPMTCLCQASGGGFWLLTVSSTGLLGFSRFRDTNLTSAVQPAVCKNGNYGEWLIFSFTYSITPNR